MGAGCFAVTTRAKKLVTVVLAMLAAGFGIMLYSSRRESNSGKVARRTSGAQAPVGDAVCISCHQAHANYAHTAHAKTSSEADANSVKGPFAPGSNVLRTENPDVHFTMEARPDGYFQTGAIRTPDQILTRSERFDVVIGSGRKGQTYLYWDQSRLHQLPVSYWTEIGSWVNSPGYVDGTADFERPIMPRCLECHATSFVAQGTPPNSYDRGSVRLGISCEKCHGPGEEHVRRFRASPPPASRADWAIVNPAKLSREQQIDACELCHAGIGKSVTPPLTFTAGDELARHLVFAKIAANAPLDVHASQVQLLERSRCFQKSPTMTCSTCHNVHTTQRELTAAVSSCMRCHQVEQCGSFARHGRRIETHCITCHMPNQDTAQIISSSGGRKLQPKVRNHRIGIYPEIELP